MAVKGINMLWKQDINILVVTCTIFFWKVELMFWKDDLVEIWQDDNFFWQLMADIHLSWSVFVLPVFQDKDMHHLKGQDVTTTYFFLLTKDSHHCKLHIRSTSLHVRVLFSLIHWGGSRADMQCYVESGPW